MTSSSSFSALLVSFAAASLLAAVGCSGKTDLPTPSTGNGQSSVNGTGSAADGGAAPSPSPASSCATKVCGSDCTPPGSDEPFACNASGQCIANSAAAFDCATVPSCLGKVCGADCSPPGTDEPFHCNQAGQCVVQDGTRVCACPEFVGDCRAGEAPADLDGDGCIDGCRAL